MQDIIYCDSAATTNITNPILDAMMPYLTDMYGNAHAIYRFGSECNKAVNKAREQVAKAINAEPDEIYFTSGGSESNTWAISGFLNSRKNFVSEYVTTEFEHPSVFNTFRNFPFLFPAFGVLEKPDTDGVINADRFINRLKEVLNRDDYKDRPHFRPFACCMAVNNEIGTIQPIAEIGKFCRENNITFHVDAVQAIGHIPIDVKAMNIDMLSLSGHKFHSPKGVGVLYIRHGIEVSPLIYGGEQERGMRAGTENVAGIVGLGKAIEIAVENLPNQKEIAKKRDRLAELLTSVEGVKINGSMEKRIANNLNVSVKCCESESLMLLLEQRGILVSAGSACSSGSLEPSRTLKSIGLSDEEALSSIRFSLSDDITDEQIDRIAEAFKDAVSRLRN